LVLRLSQEISGERLVPDIPKIEIEVRCPETAVVRTEFVDDEDPGL
jgi:hypothetical protein